MKSSTVASDALFGKVRRAVIAALFAPAGTSLHVREMARRSGVSAQALSTELSQLESAGIVLSHKEGGMVKYQANPNCRISAALQQIAGDLHGQADFAFPSGWTLNALSNDQIMGWALERFAFPELVAACMQYGWDQVSRVFEAIPMEESLRATRRQTLQHIRDGMQSSA